MPKAKLTGGPYDGVVLAVGNSYDDYPESIYMPVRVDWPTLPMSYDFTEPLPEITSVEYRLIGPCRCEFHRWLPARYELVPEEGRDV